MRNAGLVKKDVWIRPEFSEDLAAVEQRFRQAPASGEAPGIDCLRETPGEPGWTLAALQRAIEGSTPVGSGSIEVHRSEGADPTLRLVMRDYGDLPVFVAVGGLQIVVQVLMWPLDHVSDPAAFNARVLRTHKLWPLTTMGIEPVAGVPSYVMFGSLGTHSPLADILFEIEALAGNVIACVDAYGAFLRDEVWPHDEASAS
ncbi:YjfI family protein [Lysobacter sp. A3-1-A15]|uniref:YjfI family protein n=1 Tax=Novilysobacter viscosus TaxID=3098602 RepID=UPI002EDA34D6